MCRRSEEHRLLGKADIHPSNWTGTAATFDLDRRLREHHRRRSGNCFRQFDPIPPSKSISATAALKR
jgi:hypothetical protein